MSSRIRQILIIAGIAVITLAGAFAIILYRTQEIAASSYEAQAAKWWSAAAGGFDNFLNQILSMEPNSSSIPDVCHNAKVQLQNLNAITITGDIPSEYSRFHAQFMDALRTNKRYYRKIVEICPQGTNADNTELASLSVLGSDTENEYQEAHQLLPEVGSQVEEGTATEINERIIRIFQSRPMSTEQPSAAEPQEPRVIEVPRKGYSRDFPPAVGSIVYISTPRGGDVNFREGPSLSAPRIEGYESIPSGERVHVLDREGDWLLVETDDGYTGYIRWWYRGTAYVRP